MRHLTDTGKAIEEDMRRRYGRAGRDEVAERHAAVDKVDAELEQPAHPAVAVGAGVIGVVALVAALVLTPIFFISAIIATPVAIAVAVLLGAWAFWSWGQRRAAARQGEEGQALSS